MQIKVDCPSCGRSYQVDSSISALKLQCKNCGATLVPSPPAESRPAPDLFTAAPSADGPAPLTDPDELAGPPNPPIHSNSALAVNEPAHPKKFDVFHLGAANKHRRLARRLAILVAILVYLTSLGLGVLAFTITSLSADQLVTPVMLSNVALALGLAAAIGFAVATAYLVAGLRMGGPGGQSDDRGENFIPVVIILVLGSVNLLLDLLFLGILLVQGPTISAASPSIAAIAWAIGFLYLFAVAPLLYFSIRILQVRH
jgi:hypothetical protein